MRRPLPNAASLFDEHEADLDHAVAVELNRMPAQLREAILGNLPTPAQYRGPAVRPAA